MRNDVGVRAGSVFHPGLREHVLGVLCDRDSGVSGFRRDSRSDGRGDV